MEAREVGNYTFIRLSDWLKDRLFERVQWCICLCAYGVWSTNKLFEHWFIIKIEAWKIQWLSCQLNNFFVCNVFFGCCLLGKSKQTEKRWRMSKREKLKPQKKELSLLPNQSSMQLPNRWTFWTVNNSAKATIPQFLPFLFFLKSSVNLSIHLEFW